MQYREPPVFQIAEMYRTQPTRLSFREELDGYLQHGYVFNTPASFLMGRPVSRRASLEEIVDPWRVFAPEEQDAWFLAALAGSGVRSCTCFPTRSRGSGGRGGEERVALLAARPRDALSRLKLGRFAEIFADSLRQKTCVPSMGCTVFVIISERCLVCASCFSLNMHN